MTSNKAVVGANAFAHEAGIELNQVSYRSSAQAVLDVVAGRVEMQFSTLPPAVPLIREGKLRALATTGAQRVSTLPEVPTPPVIVHVCCVAVKLGTVAFAPLTVTAWLAGLNVYPLSVGVTVYDPFTNPVNV